ncbi:diguanylate cyclase (GGDEF)-like protein [Halanaerobacter jeridensis]|uniref:Diguanylate cyclase (GGDEF)-like protein n=1 Tax=Halanaerobacter jeridensis TaxID=706427 RepID=A0A939BRK8_9FIRM|nr:EAL domain-containing protein [Halanaerobacter jeridensis]MBM7557439.1 diguanylate cyclase (GGDEF)-like protein [Halanaerobacter jeridensis]
MVLLIGIVSYQYNNLSSEGKDLLEEQLLNREKVRIKSLVQTRAKILEQVYNRHRDELSQQEIEELLAEINQKADLDKNYFFIYTNSGETISLPPTPYLEGDNRWDLTVRGRNLVQEMSQLSQQGGGAIKYPYTNHNTGELGIKYGYIEPIKGTNYFVGAGTYKSNFDSIVDKIKTKVANIRDQTFYFLIFGFILVMLIIFEVILIISNYINEHINKVLTGFQKVINGRLDYKLEHDNDDEFQKLVAGFNYMVERINNLTYSDPLTGLPNMNFLETSLGSELKNIQDEEETLYLLTLGISNFSLINSNYGYHLGNELLEQIFLRLDEIIDKETTIARKSDEFILYFKSEAQEAEVETLGEEIIEQLSTPYNFNEQLVYAEPKLGIAKSQNGQTNCDRLIKRSELALHFANQNAKEVLFYSSDMQGQLSDRVDLESKLRNALVREDFLLHYQPLVDSSKDEIVGVEALIRWDHPQEGMISPGQFIPIAEDTGMIVEIGDWVLEESCWQLKEWQQQGYDDLMMSVNIAPQQFQNSAFVEEVSSIIERTGIEPQYLELEITERTVIENVEYTIDILNDLKELGVKIAIDDFGTGYSSLEYLTEFAIDTLKIDRAFIHKQKNEAIVKTIIVMGDNLELSVIAEGVETEAELEFLAQNNCYLYQGYFYSRPLPVAEMIELLEA